jgi:hypothetical protein
MSGCVKALLTRGPEEAKPGNLEHSHLTRFSNCGSDIGHPQLFHNFSPLDTSTFDYILWSTNYHRLPSQEILLIVKIEGREAYRISFLSFWLSFYLSNLT